MVGANMSIIMVLWLFPTGQSSVQPGDGVLFSEIFILGPHFFFFEELLTRPSANKVLSISGHKDKRGYHIFSSPLNVSGSSTNGC